MRVPALRLVAVVAFTLVTGLAHAQECATGQAPACNGTCPDGSVCAVGQSGSLGCECVPGGPLEVTKMSISLNFKKADKDSVVVNGLVDVPEGFSVEGKTAAIDIGGVVKTFTLDAKGKSKIGGDQIKLNVKAKKGVVLAQQAKMAIKLAKGTWSDDWADEGCVDATLEATVSMRVDVTVDGSLTTKTVTLSYKATQGKSGKAKQSL